MVKFLRQSKQSYHTATLCAVIARTFLISDVLVGFGDRVKTAVLLSLACSISNRFFGAIKLLSIAKSRGHLAGRSTLSVPALGWARLHMLLKEGWLSTSDTLSHKTVVILFYLSPSSPPHTS